MPSRILRLWNPDAAAWEEVGDSRLTAHLGAADPHAGYLLETLVDARGDLLAASAADAVGRLPLGTDGHVLTADSAQALGVKWAAAAGAGGDFVAVAGDTMTGPLTLQDTHLTVTSSAGGVGATSRLYGGSPPAPTTGSGGAYELGVRFRSTSARSLVAVRWYRVSAAQASPPSVRLWDTTATASPVWSTTDTSAFAGPATGWKELLVAPAERSALVAGRDYVLSLSWPSGDYTTGGSYTPAPDSPLVYVGHVFAVGAGSYPSSGASAAYLDPGVATIGAAGAPASSGAIRLPTGAPGAIAWRNAGDTADLALAVNASNELTFNGVALPTGSYLPLAGGTLTGDLTLSEATPTVSLQQAADTQPRSRLTDTALAFGPGGSTAPDATLSRTGAQQAALNATLTLSPAAGQPHLVCPAGSNLTLRTQASGILQFGEGGTDKMAYYANQFYPITDNQLSLGGAVNRYSVVYAVNGTIQTSSRAYKQGITPLDPAACAQAVLDTDWVSFEYTPPPLGQGPPGETVAQSTARVTAHSRMVQESASARRQNGYILGSPSHRISPLFGLEDRQSASPQADLAVVACALQDALTRIAALEGASP